MKKNSAYFPKMRRCPLVNVVDIIGDAVAFVSDLYRKLDLKTQFFLLKFIFPVKFFEQNIMKNCEDCSHLNSVGIVDFVGELRFNFSTEKMEPERLCALAVGIGTA